MIEKPPLGLMPKNIWLDKRLDDLRSAIARYLSELIKIPQEWIDEYNELIEKRNDHNPKE